MTRRSPAGARWAPRKGERKRDDVLQPMPSSIEGRYLVMRRLAALAAGALSLLIPAAAAVAATSPFAGPHNSPRVYEQVSPVDKKGREVTHYYSAFSDYGALTPRAGGDSVFYVANGGFPGAPTSRQQNYYLAERDASRWQSTSVDIPQQNTGTSLTQLDNARTRSTTITSPDLSRTIVFSRRAFTPDAVENNANIYLRDNRTGSLQLMYTMVSNNPSPVVSGGPGRFQGADDFSRLFFLETVRLTPDAPAGSGYLMYEFRDGELRLLSPIRSDQAFGVSTSAETVAVAADGSRAFVGLGFLGLGFGAGSEAPGAGLFMVDEAGDLTPVSLSERLDDGGTQRAAAPIGVASDGSSVVFQSRYPLTEESGGGSDLWRLYRYEVGTGDIVDLAPMDGVASGGATTVAPYVAVSEDGEHVYYFSQMDLTGEGSGGLYHWHDGELSLVLPSSQGFSELRVSPHGGAVAWRHAGTGNDDVWLYEADSGVSTCVSCAGNGTHSGGRDFYGKPFSRTVTDDGSVFFSSPDRLVREDRNSEYDAYEWSDGALRLVSSGQSTGPSFFAGASRGGDTVYFTSSERLVGQDRDNSTDLYAARRGGGLIDQFPVGLPAECVGDDCQGAPAVGPRPLVVGSGSVAQVDVESRPVRRCGALETAARQARSRGKRLRRQARSTTGMRAKRLRKAGGVQLRRAQRLDRRVLTCLRGGR